MPSTLIEVAKLYSKEHEVALLEAVLSALREAFKIPEWDRNIRLMVHEPHRFARPPGRGDSELFTQVSIDCFAGRSLDAKRALYQCIVRNFEALGIPKEQVTIMLREIPKEDWGVQGGQAACDVDVGFVVEV